MPEIVACHIVFGSADFLLEVVVPDLRAYERLLLGSLLKSRPPSPTCARTSRDPGTVKAPGAAAARAPRLSAGAGAGAAR